MFELSGAAPAEAAKQATAVMAFETRLAKASKSSEQLSRDVELYYHPVKLAEADKLAPNFPWTKFFESQKVATAGVVLAGHSGLPPGSEQDARGCARGAVAELAALQAAR